MSNKYTLGSLSGGDNIEVNRCKEDALEFKIGNKKAIVFTEDLAAVVREELPKDRGDELFTEIQDKELQSGMARVVVKAENDIKRGDKVCFKININKYLGTGGVRTTPSGILF